MRKDVRILLISISFGLAFWVLDAYLIHLVFNAPVLSLSSSQKEFFHDLYVKVFILIGFALFGVTVSKMSQKCQCAEGELLSQLRFENIVADISSHFIGKRSENIDEGIHLSLKKIAEFADADRGYLVLLSPDGELKDSMYQWHGEHVDIGSIGNFPGRDFPWWMEQMLSPEIIHISDISELPASAEKEKEALKAAGIMSALSIPLLSDDILIGFLGFESFSQKKVWPPNYIKLIRVVGDIFVDSIERKKAEASVLDHQIRLARAQEISHIGSWEIDLRTKKHIWSDEMYRIMGFIPGEVSVTRNTYLDMVHSDDRDHFKESVDRALSTPGYKVDIKTRVIKKNGAICVLHTLGEVVWDNDGNQLFFQGTTQDITKISIAEEELHRKNRNLLILQSTALIAASSLEMDDFLGDILEEINSYVGCRSGSIYLFSPEEKSFMLCSSTGISDGFREHISSISMDDPILGMIPDIKDTWITGKKDHVEVFLKDPLTNENVGKFVFIPIISRDDLAGIIFLFPDTETVISKADMQILGNVGRQIGITVENIRLLDETRNAYEELKSLDRMKDEFVSNITHELKTPLISIKGYSEVIYEGLLGDLDDRQKECMKVVVSNSERLERLIESLLNINSLNFERHHVFSPVHLKEILDNAVNKLALKMEERDVGVTKDYSFEIPLLYGNSEFLTSLFVYILDNAIKFSPESSDVSITIREDDRYIHVKISDHGIGIPEKCMEKIFERFYQVDGSATRIYSGNGLGLYLAKNIVDLHFGMIRIESEEGVGTDVYVSLPLYDSGIHDQER
ncbi:ATP-binding protein [Methanolobus sp. WCC4]|uniref:ATP-binding protein n=1 Tax=Methanolobus sp. WCC4 TaxID=3125784 RepID=UPI0030F67F7E